MSLQEVGESVFVGLDRSYGSISQLAQDQTILSAIEGQRKALGKRYAQWRVDRTDFGVQTRLLGHLPRFVNEYGDPVVELPSDGDHEVEVAALVLHAQTGDGAASNAAADVLVERFGEDTAMAMVESGQRVRELNPAIRLGSLARRMIEPIAGLVPSFAGKLQ